MSVRRPATMLVKRQVLCSDAYVRRTIEVFPLVNSATRTFRKAVVPVLLAREHLPFIREWCEHHLNLGWCPVLYDNTGSQGSCRQTDIYRSGIFQQQHKDKRGVFYGRLTDEVSDQVISQQLQKELSDLPVIIKRWAPQGPDGRIVYGQVEAYVDFLRTMGHLYDWAAFIDADEYLECGQGLSWEHLLSLAESVQCHRLLLGGVCYESRRDPSGHPLALETLQCAGSQYQRVKNIVRVQEVLRADVHWNWTMSGENLCARLDSHQFRFRHHRIVAKHIALGISRKPSRLALDESLEVATSTGNSQRASSWQLSLCVHSQDLYQLLQHTLHHNLQQIQETPAEIILLDEKGSSELQDWLTSEFSEALERGQLRYFRVTKLSDRGLQTSSVLKNLTHRLARGAVVCDLSALALLDSDRLESWLTLGEGEFILHRTSDGRMSMPFVMRALSFLHLGGYNESLPQSGDFDFEICERAKAYGLTEKSFALGAPFEKMYPGVEKKAATMSEDTLEQLHVGAWVANSYGWAAAECEDHIGHRYCLSSHEYFCPELG